MIVWNAFFSKEEILETTKKILHSVSYPKELIYLVLPLTFVQDAREAFKEQCPVLGVEGMWGVQPGDFTESIAVKVLKTKGVQFVLLDTTEQIELLRKEKITPVFCFDRKEAIQSINNELLESILFLYKGTGDDVEQAQEECGRETHVRLFYTLPPHYALFPKVVEGKGTAGFCFRMSLSDASYMEALLNNLKQKEAVEPKVMDPTPVGVEAVEPKAEEPGPKEVKAVEPETVESPPAKPQVEVPMESEEENSEDTDSK